jgi:hypothetical protein
MADNPVDPEFETRLAELSEADWAALVTRVRPPGSHTPPGMSEPAGQGGPRWQNAGQYSAPAPMGRPGDVGRAEARRRGGKRGEGRQ